MRTIRIELSLTDREYDYLKLGKADQPDPGRVKAWLLQSAMSALRREGEIVMQQFRDREAAEYAARQGIKVVPKAKATKRTIIDDAEDVLNKRVALKGNSKLVSKTGPAWPIDGGRDDQA